MPAAVMTVPLSLWLLLVFETQHVLLRRISLSTVPLYCENLMLSAGFSMYILHSRPTAKVKLVPGRAGHPLLDDSTKGITMLSESMEQTKVTSVVVSSLSRDEHLHHSLQSLASMIR